MISFEASLELTEQNDREPENPSLLYMPENFSAKSVRSIWSEAWCSLLQPTTNKSYYNSFKKKKKETNKLIKRMDKLDVENIIATVNIKVDFM